MNTDTLPTRAWDLAAEVPDPEIPVVCCDARISSSGVQTLLTLVRHLLAHTPAQLPSHGAHTT